MQLTKIQAFPSVFFALIPFFSICNSCIFTITNNCPYTIWPGTLAGAGTPQLPTTGFRLDSGQSIRIPSVPEWSGRIWARTGCTFDASGAGKCLTGDCGGKLECEGSGATPPASLFEITLGAGDNKDFYDVSIVDGYNVPMVATPIGAFGACNATGCASDINIGCPKELQVVGGEGGDGGGGDGSVVACKSACEAFGLDQYCCSGQFANPTTCKPSFYSTIFKRACPRAYSYAFDDGTSTFTCKAYEYSIVFCPQNNGLQKPDGPPLTPPTIPIGDPSQRKPDGRPLTPPTIPIGDGRPLTPPTIPIGDPSQGKPDGLPLTPPTIPIGDPSQGKPDDRPLTPPTIPIGDPSQRKPDGLPLTPPTIPIDPSQRKPDSPPLTPTIPIGDPSREEYVHMVSYSNMLSPLPPVVMFLILSLIS